MKIAILLASVLTALPQAVQAQAHEHGAARLDVALEAATLSLQFEAPLEALFGFERAPRSATERQLVNAGIARLKAADGLFKLDAAAHCALKGVTLTSAALALGAATSSAPAKAANAAETASAEHADLDATFEFECKDAAKLASIDVGLFEAFPRLQRIEVQVATPKGQFKRSLKRPANRISLLR
jgi:hypothetical protein